MQESPSTSQRDELVERLDQLIALVKIGFSNELQRAQEDLKGDPVGSAIIRSLEDGPMASGDLKEAVSRSAKVSNRTVQRSLGALARRGLVRVEGSGPSTTYQLTGIL